MNKTETIIYWMNTECFNEASNFEKGLNQLNEERHTITLALNQREDQNLSLAAGLLLDLAVEASGFKADVLHDHENKPYVLNHPELFISCTHCHPYAAAIISKQPVGIDIESQLIDFSDIEKHYYSDEEKNYLQSFSNNNDRQKARTDLWCRKECLIKFDSLRDLKALSGLKPPLGYRFISQFIAGYSFEILIPDTSYSIQEVTIHDFKI